GGVPGDEHAGDGGGERLVVDDAPARVDFHSELADDAVPRHPLEADGDEYELGGQDAFRSGDRGDAAVRVAYDLHDPHVAHPARTGRPVGEELEGAGAEDALTALLVGGRHGEDP